MVVMRFTALHDLFFCISAEKAFKTDITNHAYQERRGIILGFGIEIHYNKNLTESLVVDFWRSRCALRIDMSLRSAKSVA